MPPTLFVVSTPIGNLEDITLRALRVLREVDLIAAEDTRHTARLLNHYAISTPTTSFHEHNERQKTPRLIDRLRDGARIALVTDAGTPGVSDPGYRLVHAAQQAGIRVEAIPGPSAVLAALVSSGFPTDSFTFVGFPPRSTAARQRWLEGIASEPRTVVFFEAPHRIRETLASLASILGKRHIAIARELTKLHESLVIQPIHGALKALPAAAKGEFTVVVAPSEQTDVPVTVLDHQKLSLEFGELTKSGANDRRGAIRKLSKKYRIPAREVYAALELAKQSVD